MIRSGELCTCYERTLVLTLVLIYRYHVNTIQPLTFILTLMKMCIYKIIKLNQRLQRNYFKKINRELLPVHVLNSSYIL